MFQAKKFLENMHQEKENTETIEKIVEIFLVAMIVWAKVYMYMY